MRPVLLLLTFVFQIAARPLLENGGKPDVDASLSRTVSMFGEGIHTCSGTWVTPHLLLTAGHCDRYYQVSKFELNGKTPMRVLDHRTDPRWNNNGAVPDPLHDFGIVMAEPTDCQPLEIVPAKILDQPPSGLDYHQATVTGYGDTQAWFDRQTKTWEGNFGTQFHSGAVELRSCEVPSQSITPAIIPELVKALEKAAQAPAGNNAYFASGSVKTIHETHTLSSKSETVGTVRSEELRGARLQEGDSGGGVFAHDPSGKPVLVAVNSFRGSRNAPTQVTVGADRRANRFTLSGDESLYLNYQKPGTGVTRSQILGWNPTIEKALNPLGLKVQTQSSTDQLNAYASIYTPDNFQMIHRWIEDLEAEYAKKSQCVPKNGRKLEP